MFCFVMLMTAASCGSNGQESKEETYVVGVDTVRQEGGCGVMQLPGRVVSSAEANVSFKVAGTLDKVLVKEGDKVSAGQLIAVMDATDYKVQLVATQAEYEQVKAEAERVMGLYADGGATASQYDKARYGLQQMEQKLANHKHQVEYTRLKAPFSGTVQKRYFDGGETVGAGMPVVNIQGNGVLEVEVSLPAVLYIRRATFSGYTCTLDVAQGKVFGMKAYGISPKANANQLYTMRLRFDEADETIAPGMSAWVNIIGGDSCQARMCVPSTSILEDGGRSYVYIYNVKTSVVQKKEVDVDTVKTDGTAVVCGDIHAGELVVSTGVHHIADGKKVKLLEPVSKTNVGGLL